MSARTLQTFRETSALMPKKIRLMKACSRQFSESLIFQGCSLKKIWLILAAAKRRRCCWREASVSRHTCIFGTSRSITLILSPACRLRICSLPTNQRSSLWSMTAHFARASQLKALSCNSPLIYSNSAFTCFSSSRMAIPCGQWLSHLPHSRHSDAGAAVLTKSL